MPVAHSLYRTNPDCHVPSLLQVVTQVFQSAASAGGSIDISLMVESPEFGRGRMSPSPTAVELGGNQWWRELSEFFQVTQEPN